MRSRVDAGFGDDHGYQEPPLSDLPAFARASASRSPMRRSLSARSIISKTHQWPGSHLTYRWREMDSNFWFPTDVVPFCAVRILGMDGRTGAGRRPQDCLYTPTNSVENSLPSLSTTLAKGDPDVPVSSTHRHTAGLRRGVTRARSAVRTTLGRHSRPACMPPILCGSGPASRPRLRRLRARILAPRCIYPCQCSCSAGSAGRRWRGPGVFRPRATMRRS
jgi:hypothetical protein